MNIAMTTLQDQLALQVEKPSAEQQEGIRSHAVRGALMLTELGVVDQLWLDTVTLHHDEGGDNEALPSLPPARRLARILRMVDRYAAMISPRKSREGRSATDSARSITAIASKENDTVGNALLSIVGLCPPGTFVRLGNGHVAVVIRRSSEPNLPLVAIVISEAGTLVHPPQLHQIKANGPGIRSALSASAVHENLNHYLILRMAINA